MVKLKDGRRTCSCRIVESGQSLGPDYEAEVLHLLDPLSYPDGTINYVRGLENHPNRGTDPDIQRALKLIRRTNTRRAPDRMSSSDETDRQADDEESFHGFRTSEMTSTSEDELTEEDQRELERILGIIQGRIPPEAPPRRRSSTRDDLLGPGTPAPDQAEVPPHAWRTPTPPQATSSEEDTPLRIQLRSRRVLMKAPKKKRKKRKAPR